MPPYNVRTALLVVDVQNDFADRNGSLYVRGGEAVVPVINVEVEAALAGGALVAYSRDWHPAVTPHFEKDGGIWPVHCLIESWGAAFYPGLAIAEGSDTILKGSGGEDGYSAFSVRDPLSGARSGTVLEALLRDNDIERVVIVGLATDYCVKETVLDARRLGFEVEVLAAGIRAVDLQTSDGDRAVDAMLAAGAVVL